MRKLIVSNFVTLDGYYEGRDKSINSLFDYVHDDYAGAAQTQTVGPRSSPVPYAGTWRRMAAVD